MKASLSGLGLSALAFISAFAPSAVHSAKDYCPSCPGPSSLPSPPHTARSTTQSISPKLFSELEELSRIIDIAYCVGSPGLGLSKPFSCLSRCSDFPGFQLVTAFDSGLSHGDSCGYIALAPAPNPRIIVAFRGSYSLTNFISDLSTRPTDYYSYHGTLNGTLPAPDCTKCSVHRGFAETWNVTSPLIVPQVEALIAKHPGYQLVLVGHSLGGAVAGLAGLDFEARGWNPTITTFGEPRLGNANFAKYLDARFNLLGGPGSLDALRYRRVAHLEDPVSVLPFSDWGYSSHAGEIFISSSGNHPKAQDVWHCIGDNDTSCSAGHDLFHPAPAIIGQATKTAQPSLDFGVLEAITNHRDYFVRLGLCVPSLSPWRLLGRPNAA